jgi:uncharacterized membrane protein YjfL (UPF0719 family)
MNPLWGIGKGLAFVVVVSLAVTVTVRWGLVGILVALLVFAVIAVVAFAGRGPRDESSARSGHDWHEV